jgi:hypothetical protein
MKFRYGDRVKITDKESFFFKGEGLCVDFYYRDGEPQYGVMLHGGMKIFEEKDLEKVQ